MSDAAPPPTPDRPAPPAAPEPCPTCGRSAATHLTMAEAVGRFGYGRAACLECLLTDIRRADAWEVG